MSAGHHNAVLYLHSIPDSHIISNTGTGPYVAVGTYITVISNDHRACYVYPVPYDRTFTNSNRPFQGRPGFDLSPSLPLYVFPLSQHHLIGFKKMPGKSYILPSLKLYITHFLT